MYITLERSVIKLLEGFIMFYGIPTSPLASAVKRQFRYLDRIEPFKGLISIILRFFLGPEYLNNILGTNSHIQGTLLQTLNRTDLWLGIYCVLKVDWVILVLPQVMNKRCSISSYKRLTKRFGI